MIPTADRSGATRVPVQTEGHFPRITFPPSPVLPSTSGIAATLL